MNYRMHIKMLAGQIGTRVIETHLPSNARSYRGVRLQSNTVHVPPLTSLQAYYTALHELGHVARKHHRRDTTPPPKVLQQEQQAWDWAHKTAKIPATPEVQRHIDSCLNSYRRSFGMAEQ